MSAVSVFWRLLGLDKIGGTSGAVSSDIKGILLGCPPSTPPASRVETPAVPA
jgi:hypothetical protein